MYGDCGFKASYMSLSPVRNIIDRRIENDCVVVVVVVVVSFRNVNRIETRYAAAVLVVFFFFVGRNFNWTPVWELSAARRTFAAAADGDSSVTNVKYFLWEPDKITFCNTTFASLSS